MLSRRTRDHLSIIETKFFNNLNERELRRSGRNNSVVSDLHLGYLEVGGGCPFVGERLKNTGLRSRYGVNVVSISRDGNIINVPDADTRIFPDDVLGIVGTDSQLSALAPLVEARGQDDASTSGEEYHFLKLILSEDSPIVGKSAATASIRNNYGVIVVALMHEGHYVDVTPDTRFSAGDIIWVVGPSKDVNLLK